ncbi:hypothetical protein MtrunA17_Chr3g0078981 [Medicago truncatula]|uniref:Uncharacterized protein n=1 Tax=Medicago truncatula TaxID=3880 RepID=A0A396ILZ4_MEDTR|nr:hypothetical protein MtrunA17_Chr3g0078981 [Medicago truncatula]
MYILSAAPPRAAPIRNAAPPTRIDGLRPKALVIDDAKKDAKRPAIYSDDVNVVRSWLSNLQ